MPLRFLLPLIWMLYYLVNGTDSYPLLVALEKRPIGDLPPYRFASFFQRSRRSQLTAIGRDELSDQFALEPFILVKD
uniref:Secreted protein n=1 Tax=Globodera pallida TaxID=36090 RepID=A0A183BMS6_GLOPA